jgi:hypothetical protein
VAAVVVRENGRPVMDDGLFLKKARPARLNRLSKRILSGCGGARYIRDDGCLRATPAGSLQ